MAELIGLTGYKRQGKSTAARVLVEHHGFIEVAFADPIRSALETLNPLVGDENGFPTSLREALAAHGGWEGVKDSIFGPEVRRLLQVFGTEVGRDLFGPSVWVDLAVGRIGDLLSAGTNVVVPDVRFPNEAVAVGNLGGYVCRVDRGRGIRAMEAGAHRSESQVDEVQPNFWIDNRGTREHLRREVEDVLHWISPNNFRSRLEL